MIFHEETVSSYQRYVTEKGHLSSKSHPDGLMAQAHAQDRDWMQSQ